MGLQEWSVNLAVSMDVGASSLTAPFSVAFRWQNAVVYLDKDWSDACSCHSYDFPFCSSIWLRNNQCLSGDSQQSRHEHCYWSKWLSSAHLGNPQQLLVPRGPSQGPRALGANLMTSKDRRRSAETPFKPLQRGLSTSLPLAYRKHSATP